METGLAFAAVSLLCWAAIRSQRTGSGHIPGLTLIACGLTRPELVLAVAAVVPALLVGGRTDRRRLLLGLAPWVLAGMIFFAWRWHHFGAMLPLPFYIKQASGWRICGLAEVVLFVKHCALLTPLLGLPFIRGPRNRIIALLAAPLCAQLLYWLFPDHIMGLANRFLYPSMILVVILAGVSVADTRQGVRTGKMRAAFAALAVLTGLFWIGNQVQGRSRAIAPLLLYGKMVAEGHVRIGKALRQLPAGTIALGDCGAIPYYSRWRTIDTYGLNDRRIALRGHDPDYVLSMRPELVMLISPRADTCLPGLPWEQALLRRSVEVGYRPLRALRCGGDYYLWAFADRDEVSRGVAAALRE